MLLIIFHVYLLDKDSCKNFSLIVKQFIHIQLIRKYYSLYFSIVYSVNVIYF